jgi:tetratricopeptide (TPR) repeat protein
MECQEHGPESIYLCKSYFYMGQLFQQSRQAVNAKAFFQKIIQIWKNFIIQNDLLIMDMNEYPQSDISLILYEEAEVHLRIIHAWYTQEFGGYDNACAECLFTQSLVAYKRRKIDEALDGMRNALHDYQNNLGIYDRKTMEVERVIQKIEEQQQQQHQYH